MTEIIIQNEPDDYWEVLSTGLFTRPTAGIPLNWLENEDRRLGKQQDEGEEDEPRRNH